MRSTKPSRRKRRRREPTSGSRPRRPRFSRMMAGCAARAKRLEEEMNLEAKCIVAADGYESQVGRWAGFKTLLRTGDITGTLQYRLTNISEGHDFPDYCEFWLGTCAPAGYIWVFPKDESTANVGIGVSLDRLKNRVDIKGYLDRWIEQDPRMAH